MKTNDEIPAAFAQNPAYMNILTRVSVRQYDETRPVSDEQVSALLHAAMSAPSGVNRQPWEFVVVRDRSLLASLAEALPYAKMAAHAPVAIVVCGDRDRFLEGEDSELWVQDLSAASANILLAAHALGLGGVWTCIYPHEERVAPVRDLLRLPDRLIPFNLIPVGVPAANRPPLAKWDPAKIHRDRYPDA